MHPLFDNYTKWPETYRRPEFNVKAFQRKIDTIFPPAHKGTPIVRLMWSWDCTQFIAGETRAKYRFMTVKVPDGILDICPPRWILEERYEPAQYAQAWEEGRWFHDPDQGKTIDLRGPAPTNGWYNYLALVAEHDPNRACCDYLWTNEQRRCWGKYREPGQPDLDALERAKYLRDQQPYKQSPHEPLSGQVLAEIGREAFTRQEQAKEARQSELVDRFNNSIAPHAHRIELLEHNGDLVVRGKDDSGKRNSRYN